MPARTRASSGEHHEAPGELVEVDHPTPLDDLGEHVEHRQHQDRPDGREVGGHHPVDHEGHEVGGGDQRGEHPEADEVAGAAALVLRCDDPAAGG
jgi:hypothetical protein